MSGATAGAIPASSRTVSSDDGPLGRGEQRLLFRAHVGQAMGARKVHHHDREGLLLAVLAAPQIGHHVLSRGVARQVEAAEPLDRDDGAADEQARRRGEGIARERCAGRIGERQARAAHGARVRLGVEAPVVHVVVLAQRNPRT